MPPKVSRARPDAASSWIFDPALLRSPIAEWEEESVRVRSRENLSLYVREEWEETAQAVKRPVLIPGYPVTKFSSIGIKMGWQFP